MNPAMRGKIAVVATVGLICTALLPTYFIPRMNSEELQKKAI